MIEPTALTDMEIGSAELALLKQEARLTRIDYQVQNREDGGKGRLRTYDYDLSVARSAGLQAGVWGVSYGFDHEPQPERFFDDGKALGSQAVKLGASRVTMDVEYAAKNTRQGRLMKPIIDGVRAGGWQGPIDFNTLGAPENPDVNDFAMDIASFLETGGNLQMQAYANDHAAYLPTRCVRYWTRMGVPRSKLDVMISLLAGDTSKVRWSAAEWLPVLAEAGLGRAFSIFMAQHIMPEDRLPLAAVPALPPPPTTMETRATIAAEAKRWEDRRGGPSRKSRISVAKKIIETTDAAWYAVDDQIAALLDG